MRGLPDGSVGAVVTDPPYGLAFMGKEWDHGIPGVPFWAEALRVLKPGGYLAAFGGTRTYHRLACAIEDSGFQLQDCLMWLHGQGFPKGKTQLKPAWEPILLAYKPGKRTLNVDACRIGTTGGTTGTDYAKTGLLGIGGKCTITPLNAGRWPANLLLDEEAARMLDEQSGERGGGLGVRGAGSLDGRSSFAMPGQGQTVGYGDSGGASRFFYTAKASRSDRGLGNDHPTVKPSKLMRWLVRLIAPPGGTVLDPFLGSGTTAVACVLEGFSCIGIEREPHYLDIARARVAHASNPTSTGSESTSTRRTSGGPTKNETASLFSSVSDA